MAVPLTAGETENFTPPSLANLPTPPVFILKTATQRAWIAFQDGLADFPGLDKPLIFHGQEAMREEMLRGLNTLYVGEAVAAAKARLQETWQILDQVQEYEKPEDAPMPPDEAMAEMSNLADELTREWAPFRRMAADNLRWSRDAPRIAIGMFVAGWSGLTIPYERQAGVVSLLHVDRLAEELSKLEQDARGSNITGVGKDGTAFLELGNEAFSKLNLTETERKNSSSPSPSSSPPEPTQTESSGSTEGAALTASATSAPKKTRRGSSARKIA